MDVVQIVDADLKELAKVHATSAPVVDIPFAAIAVPRQRRLTIRGDDDRGEGKIQVRLGQSDV